MGDQMEDQFKLKKIHFLTGIEFKTSITSNLKIYKYKFWLCLPNRKELVQAKKEIEFLEYSQKEYSFLYKKERSIQLPANREGSREGRYSKRCCERNIGKLSIRYISRNWKFRDKQMLLVASELGINKIAIEMSGIWHKNRIG